MTKETIVDEIIEVRETPVERIPEAKERLMTLDEGTAKGVLDHAKDSAEYVDKWFDTKAPDASEPPTEFRFSYVNYRHERSVRRVPFSGLRFAECPDGSGIGLVLTVREGDGGDRCFAVSMIEPDDDEPTRPDTFAFRYGGEACGVPSSCGLRFGSTEWHPTPQLLLKAVDMDKDAEREFAVADIFREDDEGISVIK